MEHPHLSAVGGGAESGGGDNIKGINENVPGCLMYRKRGSKVSKIEAAIGIFR